MSTTSPADARTTRVSLAPDYAAPTVNVAHTAHGRTLSLPDGSAVAVTLTEAEDLAWLITAARDGESGWAPSSEFPSFDDGLPASAETEAPTVSRVRALPLLRLDIPEFPTLTMTLDAAETLAYALDPTHVVFHQAEVA